MFLFRKTFQDSLPPPKPGLMDPGSASPAVISPSAANADSMDSGISTSPGLVDFARQDSPGTFPLPPDDQVVPPFADPPQSAEVLVPPSPPRKDSVMIAEGSIFNPVRREPPEVEFDRQLVQKRPEPDLSDDKNTDIPSPRLPVPLNTLRSQENTETNLVATNPMNNASPLSEQNEFDLNMNPNRNPVAQDGRAGSAASEVAQDSPVDAGPGEGSQQKDAMMADPPAKDPFSEITQMPNLLDEANSASGEAEQETAGLNESTQTPAAENPAEHQTTSDNSTKDSSASDKQDFASESPASSEKTAESSPKDVWPTILSEKGPQNEIASTQTPVERPVNPAENSDSDFELLRWLFPALVLVGILIALFLANQRRNRPAIARIDKTKPIRGAFKNRKSNLSEESNEPMDSYNEMEIAPNPGSVTVSASGDDSEEFNFDDLNPESERHTSEVRWSEVNRDAEDRFEPVATDSTSTTDFDELENSTTGWRSQQEETALNFDRPTDYDNAVESHDSDSDFNFFADDDSDEAYQNDFAASQQPNSELDTFVEDQSTAQPPAYAHQVSRDEFEPASVTDESEFIRMDEQSSDAVGAVFHQADVSLGDYQPEKIEPSFVWNPGKIAEPEQEVVDGALGSSTNEFVASGLSPAAAKEDKPQSGALSRWFKRKATKPEPPQEVNPDSVPEKNEISNFKIADEDLGSLFGESKSMALKVPGLPAEGEESEFAKDRHDSSLVSQTNRQSVLTQELLAENVALKAQLAAAKAELETFSLQQAHQLEEYRMEQQARSSEMEDQQLSIKKLHSQLGEIVADRDRLFQRLESLSMDQSKAAQLAAQLQAEIADLSAAKSELETFSRQQTHQLEEDRLEQQALSKVSKEQQSSIKKLQDELSEIVADRDRLQQRLESLSLEQADAARLAAQLQAEIADLSGAKSELEAFSRQQTHQLEEDRLEQQALSKVSKEQQSSIKKLQDELAESLTDRNQLREELESLNSSKRTIEEQLQVKMVESARQLNDLSAELQGNLAITSQQRDRLQQELAETNCSRDALAQMQDDLRNELEQLAADKEALLSKLESTRDANDNLMTQTLELERELGALREQNETAARQLDELNKQVAETKERQKSSEVGDGTEVLSRQTKEKFTRLFKSYERERRLRKEAEQFLTEAEEQIVQLRNKTR